MTARILIGAILFILAAMPAAYGGEEESTDQDAGALVSGSQTQAVRASSDEGSGTARTTTDDTRGGAIFMPFSEGPKPEASHQVAAPKPPKSEGADFTLTAAVALGGMGLFAYVLRRVLNA